MVPRNVFLSLILLVSAGIAFGDSQKRVNPPNDSQKMHLSVVGNTNDPQFDNICRWFETDPNLMALKSSLFYHAVTTDTEIFKERYAPNVNGLPTVRLQRANGVVIYEQHDKNIPNYPSGLYYEITLAIDLSKLPWRNLNSEDCPWRNRCRPQPQPQPKPEPPVIVEPQVEPPVMEPVQQTNWMLIVLLCSGSFALGAVGGVAVAWRESSNMVNQ